jgi:hypothetical protein
MGIRLILLSARSHPPSIPLAWAVLNIILCCLPFGIVAAVLGSYADSAWHRGDVHAANAYSHQVRGVDAAYRLPTK